MAPYVVGYSPSICFTTVPIPLFRMMITAVTDSRSFSFLLAGDACLLGRYYLATLVPRRRGASITHQQRHGSYYSAIVTLLVN